MDYLNSILGRTLGGLFSVPGRRTTTQYNNLQDIPSEGIITYDNVQGRDIWIIDEKYITFANFRVTVTAALFSTVFGLISFILCILSALVLPFIVSYSVFNAYYYINRPFSKSSWLVQS